MNSYQKTLAYACGFYSKTLFRGEDKAHNNKGMTFSSAPTAVICCRMKV